MLRNRYSLYPTALLLLTLLSTVTASATRHIIDDELDNGITVLDGSWGNSTLECTIAAFESDELSIHSATFHTIRLSGEPRLLESGAPALPYLTASIALPDNGASNLQVIELEYTDFPGLQPEPSKGNLTRDIDPATVPYTFGTSYQDESFPIHQVEVDTPYILRDIRGQVIRFQPFQWLPREGVLRVYHRIIARVTTDSNRDGENSIERAALPSVVDGDFHSVYRHHFINFENNERYEPLDEQGPLLIITPDSFFDIMLPLVEWKRQKGIPTEMVNLSEVGNTASQVLSYVQNYYDNPGLAFLLLVGDAEDLPSLSANGGAADPGYAILAGDDYYPEIFVGRFSGETPTQIATMVQRSIEYERDAAAADWNHRGMGIASNQGVGDDGEYDNEHIDNIRDLLLAYTYTEVDQIYDPSGTAAMVTNGLNEGRSIINYCGHGSVNSWSSTGFSSNHVNSLTNDNMLPFIQSVACVNGQFPGGTCFAEAWLRATNGNEPTGAVAMYASSVNQSWSPPMSGQDEFNDLLVADEKHSYGGLCFNGSMQMIDDYGSNGSDEFLNWHIFGDPSLVVRTDSPAPLSVLHAGALMSTLPTYAVTVTGVEGALCALYGDEVLYGSALTDPGGGATITLSEAPEVGATLSLTVTVYNYATYQGEVNVIPPDGPYVAFSDCTVMDLNGELNPGENPLLSISVVNLGVMAAQDVTITLLTEDPYVTLLDAVEFYGSIAPEETVTVEGGFQLAVAPETPDGHTALFTLQAAEAREMWESNFTISVQAPLLTMTGIFINDGGDGILDPGEAVELEITLTNDGSSTTVDIDGLLSSSDEYITIDQAECPLPEIAPGGNGLLVFGLSVDPATPIGHAAGMLLQLTGDPYAQEEVFFLGIGQITDGFETGDFSAAPWELVGDSPWVISSENPYEGSFCARSGTVGNDGRSELFIQVIQAMAEDLTFKVKTSSQSGSDPLVFSVDGTTVDSWSGSTGWQTITVPLTAGNHLLSWAFVRDGSGGGGDNCAWLDLVAFPPAGFPPDTNPPAIFHTPLTDTDNNGPWTVGATLHDPSGLTAEIEYRFDGAAWHTVPLATEPGDCEGLMIGFAPIGTLVEYRIVAVDGSENYNSIISDTWSFIIEAPHGIEYCQDFETADFDDWTVEDWGDGNSWEINQYEDHGFTAFITYSAPGAIEHAGLVSPIFDCSSQATLELSFWQYLRMGYSGSWTLATVWGSIDGGETWSVMLAQWDSAEYGDVEIITDELVDISGWACGQDQVRLMFEYEAEYDWYWHLDEICLNGVLIQEPNGITDLEITWTVEGNLQLYWSSIPEADSYNVYYSALPHGPWVLVDTIFQPGYAAAPENGSGFFQVTWVSNRVTGNAPTSIDPLRGMRPAVPLIK